MRSKAAVVALFATPLTASATVSLLVPAYFDPSTSTGWSTLTESVSPQVPITAIMNPDNGPTSSVESQYTSAISSFETAGGQVVGYIYTTDGSRSISAVEQDVAAYKAQYPNIDGIFVDEMAVTKSKLSYYKTLYSYIKSENPDWQVIGNPGTSTLSTYLSPTPAAADELLTFENGSGYTTYTPSSWQSAFSPGSFANIAYAVPDAATMQNYLSLAVTNRAGNVYFTDASGSNPYSRLPTYWTQEAAAVQAENMPEATYIATGAGDYNAAANWSGTVPNGINAEAEFLGSISASHEVYSDVPITLGTIVFNNSSTYVLGGAGTLTLESTLGPASILAQAGTQKITLPITIASNTVFNTSSGATLSIDGPVIVQSGAVLSETGSGRLTFLSTVTVQPGGAVELTAGASLQSMTLDAGSAVSLAQSATGTRLALQLGDLAVASQATLKLNGQDLIINNGDLAAVDALIRQGQLGSSGIDTADNDLMTIGAILNNGGSAIDSFDGIAVTATDVLLRSTLFGDATLSGSVNAADYTILNNGFNQQLTGWSNGDFNYDGIIDGSDYTLIDNACNSTGQSASGDVMAEVTSQIAGAAPVPEPACLAILSVGILSLRRRRRFTL